MTLSPYNTTEQSREDHDSIHNYIDRGLLHFESEQSQIMRDVQQLRSRNAWLTGAVLALFLGLGGLGTWLILSSRTTPPLENLEDTALLETPIASRIQQLEQDVQALKSQIPADLLESLSINQGAIQKLEAQLQQLINKLNAFQLDPSSLPIPAGSSELDEIEGGEPSANDLTEDLSIEKSESRNATPKVR